MIVKSLGASNLPNKNPESFQFLFFFVLIQFSFYYIFILLGIFVSNSDSVLRLSIKVVEKLIVRIQNDS